MDPGGRYQWRSPQALTATISCAFMIGCGRWGAHLGVPPIYLGDLLLAVAVAHATISWALAGTRPASDISRRRYPALAVAALGGWALLRFLLGANHGLDALRDLAPYAYAAVAFLTATAYAHSSAANRARTLKLLEVALIGHLLWMLPARIAYDQQPVGPGLHLFLPRADVDGAVLGVTACLFLLRYLHRGGLVRLLVAVVSLGLTLSLSSRASALAAFAGLLLTLWCYFLGSRQTLQTNPRRRVAVAGLVPFVVISLALAIPETAAGSKLLASIGAVQADSARELGGLGTARARRATWRRVVDYTTDTPSRLTVGVGFGPNFMLDSGASIALLNDDDPTLRSPHNFFLGTFARLGLVGLFLLGLVILGMLGGIWRVRRFAAADELVLLAVIVPPIMLVVAAFGVVLEAPFGAIPFFWFLGVLLAKPQPPVPEKPAEEQPELLAVSAR